MQVAQNLRCNDIATDISNIHIYVNIYIYIYIHRLISNGDLPMDHVAARADGRRTKFDCPRSRPAASSARRRKARRSGSGRSESWTTSATPPMDCR